MKAQIYFYFLVLSITFTVCILVSNCKDTTPRPYVEPKAVANRDDFPNQINTVCLEGHTYYYTYSTLAGSSAMLAAKLNDDGTPTKCKGEQ